MAKGVNLCILIGNLGKDPDVSYTPSGLAVAKFSLATTEKRKQGDEWTEETQWYRIVAFGKVAEVCGQYLTKGSTVYIEGKIKYGQYEKEGVKVYTTDIIVNILQMLGGKSEDAPAQQIPRPAPKPKYKPVPDDDIEDLPF